MDASVIVALISGLVTIVSVIVSNSLHSAEMNAKLDKALAIQQTKLDCLTDEVKKHNNFAQRLPVIEEKICSLERRVDSLEKEA